MAPFDYRALGRLPAGEMNKTEKRYADLLELRKRTGTVLFYKFEPVSFRLADRTFYQPDFLVITENRECEFHEVKGFWTEDARVKIKVAASMYPFRFLAAKWIRGEWQLEEF